MCRILFLILAATISVASLNAGPITIKISDLNQGRYVVEGALGVPLGTAVEVTGQIVAGATIRPDWEGKFCIKVDTVAGVALCGQPTLLFDGSVAGVPSDRAELVGDVYRDKRPPQEEMTRLERAYVGKRMRLMVAEYGEFVGYPRGTTEDCFIVMAGPFELTTNLVILSDRTDQQLPSKTMPTRNQ